MNSSNAFLLRAAIALFPLLALAGLVVWALHPSQQAQAQVDAASLPVRGAAPEIANRGWLNTDRPLPLSSLRGQVVLVEFWTFDCINCIRTIPYVQSWHETYAEQGLQVIGVHYPEFNYEHDVGNIRAAALRLGITYPIALDNDGTTWDAYGQRFWSTIHLIDKQGNLRYISIGEGRYDATDAAIRALLAEPYTATEPTATLPAYLTPTLVLNVRDGAGIDRALLGAIEPNNAFYIEGEQNGWYAIQYGDFTGWVSGEYVTVSEGE
jgi:thiol-disulfide isomerase/thioredoxin